ncbi:MAG TPA: phosphatidate cytidylyltransferase [Pedobacter sp.]
MEKKLTFLSALLMLSFVSLLSGCQVIGDIFKAGYYVGIFVVIAVLLVIFWVFSFFRKR